MDPLLPLIYGALIITALLIVVSFAVTPPYLDLKTPIRTLQAAVLFLLLAVILGFGL